VVSVVVGARILVSRLDVEGAVVGAKRGINSRTPISTGTWLPRIGAECPRPGHVVDSAGQACRGHGESQTTEEDFVAPTYRQDKRPIGCSLIE